MCGLCDDRFYGACALNLQNQGALKFDCPGEKNSGAERFSKHRRDLAGVAGDSLRLFPGFIKPHDFAADTEGFKIETLKKIALSHCNLEGWNFAEGVESTLAPVVPRGDKRCLVSSSVK